MRIIYIYIYIYIYITFFPANVVFAQILIKIMHLYIPVIFLPLAFCRRKKAESQISFFAYVVFAKILIKIMHVYIIHIYVYMKVTRPRVHYRVITLWVSISSCCWGEFYAEVLKHIF
jgi:hypothetical protein